MLGPLKGKALQSFKESDAWLNIWEGSVSSSKTVTVDLRWIDYVINGPQGKLLMVGKTERTLKRNVIDPLITMFGSKNINTVGMGRGEIHIFGRKVYLVGANDERAEQKIRGLSLVGAYCDEITLYPESFFQMLVTRLREPGAKLFGTTNPDGPYHWLKANYLDRVDTLDLKRFHFTLDDNPYLDPVYVENLKRTYTGLWYRRYILGEWCLAEGAIYDMWDPGKHVVDKPPFEPTEWYVGIDYGTQNPTCFLMIGVHNKSAYCSDEYYYESLKTNKQKTDDEYAQDLKTFIGDKKIRAVILDPSAASFKTLLRRQNIPVRDGDNSVIDGIRTVATLLSTGRYFVHKSCKNHIMEFSSYVWDEKSQVNGIDKPMKANDHAMDACRYALHTVIGKGIGAKPVRAIM